MNGSTVNELARHSTTLVELLRRRAAQEPDRVGYTFLVDGEQAEVQATYASLDRQARAIGAWLQSQGATGERALLLYPPGLDYIAAFFGCLYAGVTAVPAFPPRPNRPMPRLQTIIADGQVKLVLTATAILENLERRISQTTDLQALRWLNTDQVPAGLEEQWQQPHIDRNSLAFLQYTSGSTSTPKGVMLSHGNLMHNLSLIQGCFEASPDCRSVFWLPPYHDMGLIGGILQPLYAGAPALLMAPATFLQCPFRWLEAISRTRAVVSGAPNFAYDLCVQKTTPEQRASLDLSSWALAFNGAEPVRADTLERFAAAFGPCGFRRTAFYPCYGLAEGTLLATGSRRSEPPVIRAVDGRALGQNQVRLVSPEAPEARTLVGSGRSPASQCVRIVDPQTRLLCPPDEVGEIWIQGPSVAQGYWGRREESEQTFAARLAGGDEGPFLRTGDLGFLHDDELFVTGRAKDLIILRGKNHYPQDIELTVETSGAAVRPSCVAAFSVEVEGEERLVIVAEAERGRRKEGLADAMRAMREAVAAHHEVNVWSVVLIKTLTIPKTSSGKIQRHACRDLFLHKGFEAVAEWTQPATDDRAVLAEAGSSLSPMARDAAAIQDWLIANIAERSNMPAREVDIHEPFARFGMDSMTALMLAGDLETWLGRRLPPTVMYDFPSIEALGRHLAEATPEDGLATPNADGLLAQVDELSADEANALLQELLAEEAGRDESGRHRNGFSKPAAG